jgi:ribonucleoside-diphosphate reductase alpha chain
MLTAIDTLRALIEGLTEDEACAAIAALRPVLGGAAAARASTRTRLPMKRRGFGQQARVGGHTVHFRTGEYRPGDLGEIWIDIHKEGAVLRGVLNAFAIAVSIGLQHGVPLASYVHSLVGLSFGPNGTVEEHERITSARSIIDYLFRALAIEYLGREDLADRPPEVSP